MSMLSPAEAAFHCGVSVDAVRRAIKRGDLPASRVFNRVRVDEDDLAAYIEAGTVGGAEVQRRRPAAPRRAKDVAAGSLSEVNRRMAA